MHPSHGVDLSPWIPSVSSHYSSTLWNGSGAPSRPSHCSIPTSLLPLGLSMAPPAHAEISVEQFQILLRIAVNKRRGKKKPSGKWEVWMACGKQWEGELPGHGSEPWMLRHVNTCLSMEVNPVWNGLWSAGALRAADLLPAALPGQLLHSQRSPWVLFSL